MRWPEVALLGLVAIVAAVAAILGSLTPALAGILGLVLGYGAKGLHAQVLRIERDGTEGLLKAAQLRAGEVPREGVAQ